MIFIKTSESINVSPEYEGISKRLSFSDLSELVSVDINAYNDLQKKFNDGNRLYPDLISSLFRKMYENGYTYRNIVRESLLSCSHFLQSKKFKFLGFIRRDNETDKDNNEIDYFTEWDFVENYYKLKNNSTQKISTEKIGDVLDKSLFENSFNVFFVAGNQTIEMLDLRIKKAAVLLASLINNKYFNINDTKVILSGLNNAKVANSKVQFTNESLTMRNLLIHKIVHYLKTDLNNNLDDNFFNKIIESEIESRDTKENIEKLFNKLNPIIEDVKIKKNKQLNLFIISSTFHLLQLSDHVIPRENNLREKLKNANIDLNLFFVGGENPTHFFKIFDRAYIKLLLNEVIHRNFKFCRKNK